jgi:5'-nucleotidase
MLYLLASFFLDSPSMSHIPSSRSRNAKQAMNAFLSAALALTLLVCVPIETRAQEPVKVKIIAINDFHGYLLPPPDFDLNIEPIGGGKRVEVEVGGAAALASVVKKLRAQTPFSIFVSGGDLVGGSPAISSWTLEEATINIMNQMGLELSTIGNHEFDRGKAELKRLQHGGCAPPSTLRTSAERTCAENGQFLGAKFPYLAANAIDQETGKPLFAPTFIKEFGSIKIGFVGVSLLNTPGTTRGAAGVTFLPEAEVINRYAKELRAQGANAVIALVHQGGTTTARRLNDKTCPGLSGDIVPVVQKLSSEVDIVISAHTHKEYICTINGILITQAGYYGNLVTEIDLSVVDGKGVVAKTARNIPVINELTKAELPAGYEIAKSDPQIAEAVAFYDRLTEPERKKVFGHIASDIDRIETDAGTRIDVADHPLGRVLADAFLDVKIPGRVVDIGMINSGGLRSTVLFGKDGSLTYDDVFAVAPFNNELVFVQLTGAQLLRLLEQQWEAPNCKAKQYHGMCGRLLQVSHTLKYKWRYDPKEQGLPEGKGRMIIPGSVTIKGRKLDPKKSYGIVAPVFLAVEGGDNFSVFRKGQHVADTLTSDIQAISAKLAKTSKQKPLEVPPPRIVCVGCGSIP